MGNTNDNELLTDLQVQIERAWNARQDDTLVDRLADEHPDLAEDLYIFFADVLAMTLEPDDRRSDLAAADGRIRDWLETIGYRSVGKAYQDSKVSATSTPTGNSLLGMLKDTTGLNAKTLAASLDINSAFLLDISEHAALVPERVRLELARRIEEAWGIREAATLLTLQQTAPAPMQRAASRGEAFKVQDTTYEAMVRRSGLDVTRQRYWLSLA